MVCLCPDSDFFDIKCYSEYSDTVSGYLLPDKEEIMSHICNLKKINRKEFNKRRTRRVRGLTRDVTRRRRRSRASKANAQT